MKRTVSFVLAMVITCTFICTLMAGCGKKNSITAKGLYDEEISVGEWLRLVNNKFNFKTSLLDQPAFENITSDNAYYNDVQAAVSAYILPIEYSDLNVDANLTREFCAITLAGAFYYNCTEKDTYIRDIDNCTYADQVRTVVNTGIMALKQDGSFSPTEELLYVEASIYLENAYTAWAEYSFDELVYECEFNENVVDFVGITQLDQISEDEYAINEAFAESQKSMLDEAAFEYHPESNTITADSIDSLELKEGSVVIIPSEYGTDTPKVVLIEKIEESEDWYTLHTGTPELTDVYEDLSYQDTIQPDFSECEFYWMDGTPIQFEDDVDFSGIVETGLISNKFGQIMPLSYTDDVYIQQLDNPFSNHGLGGSMDLGDYKLKIRACSHKALQKQENMIK